MGSRQKLEIVIEMKSEADKVWEVLREATTMFPKALPHLYESVDVLEGDGVSVGTVRKLHYAAGQPVKTNTETILAVDEENRTLFYSNTDGDLNKIFTNLTGHIVITPKSEGSTVKYTFEFDKLPQEIPQEKVVAVFASNIFKGIDAYLTGA